MQSIPNILAYPLDDAVRILEENGLVPQYIWTASPKCEAANTKARVVRLRPAKDPNVVELTAACENWG